MIKPATAKDLPELIQLINASFSNANGQGAGWTSSSSVTQGPRINHEDPYELIIGEKNLDTFTILKYHEENQEVIGCVRLEIETRKEKGEDKKVCLLGLLSVLPGTQSKGVGSKLLEAAENWARSKGCSIIEISVPDTMVALQEYYERRGFLKTGKIIPFPSNFYGTQIPLRELYLVYMERVLNQ